ncbi:MAG: hypothetical protein ABIY56_11650, partial [Dokdonella sp.]
MDYQLFQQALRLIEQKAASRSTAHDTGDLADKADVQRVGEAADTPETWDTLATQRVAEGNPEAAVAAWEQALECHIDDFSLLHRVAEGLRGVGRDPVKLAERVWMRAPSKKRRAPSKPRSADNRQAACLAVLRGDWEGALQVVQAQFNEREASRRVARNLAFLLEQIGQPGRAQCVIATNLLVRGEVHAAAVAFLAAPPADAQSPEYLTDMLSALRRAGEEAELLRIAEAAALAGSCPAAARLEWARTLLDLHRYEDAYAVLRDGAAQLDDQRLRLEADLILPSVPALQSDMDRAHQRAHRNIRALSETPLPDNRRTLEALEAALIPIFYMSYLGIPCVDEIRTYGRFVSDVVAARFPDAADHVPQRRRADGTR